MSPVKVINEEVLDCSHCNSRYKSIFCDLGGEDLQRINQHKSKHYDADEIIFQQGTIPKGLFCVNSGKVKIYATGSSGVDQIIRFATAGDIIGYRALLSGDKYFCSAEALEQSSICFIPKENIFGLVNSNIGFALRIIKLLSSDLKSAMNQVHSFSNKNVRERVAEGLLIMKECFGLEEDNKTIAVELSREEISNLVASTRETVSRTLKELSDEKIILLKNKKIKIINLKKLIESATLVD